MDQEFKERCIRAGFVEVNDVVVKLEYLLASTYDEEITSHPPKIIFEQFVDEHFCFVSGLQKEMIHLNTLDPEEAIKWGKMISHIEPNF